MPRFSRAVALLALLLVAETSFAAAPKFSDVASVRAEVVPAKARRGETVTYRITVEPKAGYWTYPVKPVTGQASVTSLDAPPPDNLVFVTDAIDPPPGFWKTKPDENNALAEIQYSPDPVTWEFKAVVSPDAKPGMHSVKLGKLTSLQVCNKQACIPSDNSDLPLTIFEVSADARMPVEAQFAAAVAKALAKKTDTVPPAPGNGGGTLGPERGPERGPKSQPEAAYKPKEAKPVEQVEAELKAIDDSLLDKPSRGDSTQQESLGAFVLTAVIWGLISLVTPCVFPMIPITVSIFLKHAHGSFRERMKLAGVYCLTIIVVLGLSAFALLKFMAWLSVLPITNVLLGALFIVLALSLFGMYELTLPNFIVKRLQSKQAKGGVVGTIFGALAFTVISFTCVAPFLGGFAGITAASGANDSFISFPRTREIVGGLAFATAFAAPFFILALVPGLLKALPKSGGWLDSVKVVMGFLEVAAALKFFRTAELGIFSPAQYFTYDLVLAGWVAIALACGLYLLNAYRLPHDEEKPNIGVMRLLFALMFLGLGIYLLPGLFKGPDGKPQRPNGAVFAWVDAFLLPEPKHLGWGTDLNEAIAKVRADAEKTGKPRPIFVDFTGVTCTNCKYNENSVFPLAKVNDLLDQFERVQLYTDWLPSESYVTDPGDRARKLEGYANRDFQQKVFTDIRLPLYAVLLPTANGKVRVLGIYDEGKINAPDRFAAWLKEMLEKAKK